MEMPINYFVDKKIFVTGAGGFIGRHLVLPLLERGAEVSALFHPSDIAHSFEKKLSNVFIADLKDEASVNKIFDSVKPDIIYHLAAINSIPYSKEQPAETIKVNFNGTLNLLEAARNNGGGKFIYISSAEIYSQSNNPINENQALDAGSPYAVSKIAADCLVQDYHRIYGVRSVIARPFNIYGPGNYKNVIFKFIKAALKSEDLKVEGGGQIKDFIYVEDFVRALLLAGENDAADGEIFNVGSQRPVAIRDLAEWIIAFSGSQSRIVIGDRRDIGSKNLISDSGKIRTLLNWNPQIDLQEGLKKTIDWAKYGC